MAPNTTQTSRIDYIDIAKALGMFTIIWGHIMLYGMTNYIVYAFHIPLFFFLSGMMFRQEKYPTFISFLKKRAKTLLIPYVIYSFATWLVWYGYILFTHSNVDSVIEPLFQTFIAQGSGGFLVHNVPLWFVTCLFVVEIGYYGLAKLTQNQIIVASIACAVIGTYMMKDYSFFDFKLLPWNIEVAFCAIPFYALGNILMKHFSHANLIQFVSHPKKKVLAIATLAICLIILVFGAWYNKSVSMGHAYLGKNAFVFYLAAICGIAIFMAICIKATELLRNWKAGGGMLKYLKWFGRNSFDAMAIHNPIKGFIVVVIAAFFHTTTSAVSANYLYSLYAFVCTLLITSICMIFINKIKRICHKKA